MTPLTPSAAVRAATAADVARICQICSEAYTATYQELLPQAFIDRTVRDFYNPDRVEKEVSPAPPHWFGYQVVEESGRVLGAAGGGMTGPGVGELFVIYLDPNERDRGLGTLLLDRVTAQISATGAKEMWVSVAPGNQRGIPFYEARGFTPIEQVKTYSSLEDEDIWSLRMRRNLPT